MLLGLLATKPDYQNRISAAGALPGLVSLLKRYAPVRGAQPAAAVARRAADAITNLAHENADIKDAVRGDACKAACFPFVLSPWLDDRGWLLARSVVMPMGAYCNSGGGSHV